MRDFWALVTVQHSGTRFVLETLRPHFAAAGLPLTRSPRDFLYPILYQHHCNTNALPWIDARRIDGVKIITTDRKHDDIAASWQRRYGNRRRLETVYSNWREHVLPIADVIITLDGTEDAQLAQFVTRAA